MSERRIVKGSYFPSKTHMVGMSIIIVIIFGLIVDSTNADSNNFYSDIIRLDNVATKVHQNYVEELKSEDLVDNAIKGMLEILDPHSVYFKQKDYEELRIHTEGKFGGLGLQISIRDSMLTVITPISGTPAALAGIQTGDQILQIDGKSTAGLSIEEAVDKLRGEPKTDVTITIRRKGEPKTLEYTITREIITIKSVDYAGTLKGQIGYIRLITFSQETSGEMEKAIKNLLKQNIKGMILDLRNNPGGLLPQAIEVAEKFLDKKSLVVSTRGRVPNQNKDFFASNNPVLPKEIPLVVLVNGGSASASEIVAGAIQDWDRGVVLGDTTFGKGSVQSILPLDNEQHYLKLTTAFYYTPSGRCINKAENGIRGAKVDSTMVERVLNPDNRSTGDSTGRSGGSVSKSKKPDRDTMVYKTKMGRIMFGGGGIVPDSVLKEEIGSMVMRALESRDHFFRFANLKYPPMHKKNVVFDSTFAVDKKLLDEFFVYLDSVHFELKSYASVKFDEFKEIAGLTDTATDSIQKVLLKPEWQDKELAELKKITMQIEDLLKREQKREFIDAAGEIKNAIRMAFLRREYGYDHNYVQQVRYGSDKQILAAVGLLSDKKVYSNLLQFGRMTSK